MPALPDDLDTVNRAYIRARLRAISQQRRAAASAARATS